MTAYERRRLSRMALTIDRCAHGVGYHTTDGDVVWLGWKAVSRVLVKYRVATPSGLVGKDVGVYQRDPNGYWWIY